MDSKRSTAEEFGRQIRADHPKAEWEHGYTTSGKVTPQQRFLGLGPLLYTAWQNKETGEVHYLHGRQLRTASPALVRRFKRI